MAGDKAGSGGATPVAVADEGFLSRWSRRSALARQGHEEPEPLAAVEPVVVESVPPAEAVRIDARTGKPYDELTDEDMPPIESLDQSSDLSVFLAKNVSPLLRMKAFSRVFHTPEYNQYCLCAEYADDYTQFTPLGSIVPHDLKAAIAREAQTLRDRLLARGKEISLEDAEARVLAEREAGQPQVTLTEEEERLPLVAGSVDGEIRQDDAATATVGSAENESKA
ncbi:MAG TPA: DUF3306 domain-containing protein [Gammaproteobacteria bacterium]|nr:DUF3306 domain-containing protein [Gammaproteobacteria bacterium]